MKRNPARWIPAALTLCAIVGITGCAPPTTTKSQLKKLQQENPGLEASCKDSGDGSYEVVAYTDIGAGAGASQAASDINGEDCDPSQEQVPVGGQQGQGTTTTKTDNAQPKTMSQAIEPATASPSSSARLHGFAAAGASYQIQDEYPNLLPLPFTPLFTAAALASYTYACNPNASFYMVNYNNSTVTHLASCPLAVIKVIPVPLNPVQVRITPDGSTAVVTTYNNVVAFIDTATDAVTTLSTPQYNPYGVDISPDGSKAYITSYSTAVPNLPAILVINLATRRIVTPAMQTQQGNSAPKSIFLTPDGALAWVNFSQTSAIQIIDTLSMTVSATVTMPGTADTGIAFSPDGTRAYVSIFSGSVAVFNTATLAQVASISVAAQPTDILVSKDGSTAFVNSFAANGVTSIIDTGSNTVIGTIPVNGPTMGLTLFH